MQDISAGNNSGQFFQLDRVGRGVEGARWRGSSEFEVSVKGGDIQGGGVEFWLWQRTVLRTFSSHSALAGVV